MKKGVVLVIGLILLFTVGAVAQGAGITGNIQKKVERAKDGKAIEVSKDTFDYLKDFLEKGGVRKEMVRKVKELDKSSLPDNAKIEKIDDSKVGIYDVEYDDDKTGNRSSVFVVTYSTTEFEQVEESVKIVNYLNYGFAGDSNESSYLKTSNGVLSGSDKGYVMMRGGSVTGISTNIDLDGDGKVSIKVYKNGEDTEFGNLISVSDKKKVDYDLQSEDVVTFEPGDVVSVYIEVKGDVVWGEVITMVETTS